MLLLVAFLLMLGLVLTADRPRAPESDQQPAATASRAPAVRSDAPAPRESAPAVRVFLRAHVPEREDDPSRAGPTTTATVAPPPAAHHPRRGAPFAVAPSHAALIYALCTLLC